MKKTILLSSILMGIISAPVYADGYGFEYDYKGDLAVPMEFYKNSQYLSLGLAQASSKDHSADISFLEGQFGVETRQSNSFYKWGIVLGTGLSSSGSDQVKLGYRVGAIGGGGYRYNRWNFGVALKLNYDSLSINNVVSGEINPEVEFGSGYNFTGDLYGGFNFTTGKSLSYPSLELRFNL